MLRDLFGSVSAERILLYLAANGEGYGTEIARAFETDLSPIQKQLEKMESTGLLKHRKIGRVRLYCFDTRYALIHEVEGLVNHALKLCQHDIKAKLNRGE